MNKKLNFVEFMFDIDLTGQIKEQTCKMARRN